MKELLGNISATLMQRLLERKYGGDETSIPSADYLSALASGKTVDLSGVGRIDGKYQIHHKIGAAAPDTASWLETLAGEKLSWPRAFITFPTFVQGDSFINNPIRRILAPRSGRNVAITTSGDQPSSATVCGAARPYGTHKSNFKAVEITYNASSKLIDMAAYEVRQEVSVSLSLQYEYKPYSGFAPIHEIAIGWNTRIKEFYWKLWHGGNAALPGISTHETFLGAEATAEAEAVERFCAVVGNRGDSFKTARNDAVKAPMDCAIVTGWKAGLLYNSIVFDIDPCIQAIMKSIFPSAIGGNLLKLVHLPNGFRMMEGATSSQVGGVRRAEARIVSAASREMWWCDAVG